MSKISGKKVLLTGANSGIGLEVLRILVSQNNTVFAVDLNTDNISDIKGVIPFVCDVSTKEGVDRMIRGADKAMGSVDIFYANAGYTKYGEIGSPDWDSIDRMYRTNVFSPIYSYERYAEYLDGRNGIFAVTDSAMGLMGMPGFSLYTSTKFAVNGFLDALRYEVPKNIQITVLYPVSTDTNFFRVASDVEFDKPFPVQSPEHVAERMVRGMEKGKRRVFPCRLFSVSMIIFQILPFVKRLYICSEKKKLIKHTEIVRSMKEQH